MNAHNDKLEKATAGIKTGLVAAQAIVAKHTDGYVLVPVETELNAFIEQTQRLLERSKACGVNPKNASKKDYYNGQSHGIEMVLDGLKDVISDALKLSPEELQEARKAFELMIYKTTGWTIEPCYRPETNDYHQATILNPDWQKFQNEWAAKKLLPRSKP